MASRPARITGFERLGPGSFSALPESLKGKVDAVAANPPYVRPDELNSLPQEVRDYEAKEALFDREDGLFFTEQIIKGAKDFLKTKGLLALEMALGQAQRVQELLGDHYEKIEIIRDLSGKDRVVLARKK